MIRAGYPELARHQAGHDQVRTQVHLLVDRFHQTGVAAEDLLAFLTSWLSGHVLSDDKLLADFLAAAQRGGPSSQAENDAPRS